jgi:beta-N-acetylhexosaminidase
MKAGAVMFDLSGPRLGAEEKELLRHPSAGGVILFARNFESPRQLRALTAEIRTQRSELLIAVDHEGGRVQRFQEACSESDGRWMRAGRALWRSRSAT